MQATVEEEDSGFRSSNGTRTRAAKPYTTAEDYQQGEIVMQEDDRSYC